MHRPRTVFQETLLHLWSALLRGLKATVAASLRFESFVRTISRGVPGLTRAALKYSVPKSMPSTPEAAEADVEKRSRTKRGMRDKRGGLFLRPGGNIMREKLDADFGVCFGQCAG